MGIMHKNTAIAGLGTPSAALETVVYVTPAVQTGQGDGVVGISGTINITPGVAATGVIIRARYGPNGGVGTTNPAGVQVGTAAPTHTVAAAAPQSISYGISDTTAFTEQAGGGQYAITVQQVAATGNATMNLVDIEVIV